MVGAAGSKDDDGTKKQFLDVFDGSNAGDYRRWRRRAELYLQGLPTTVPEKKWGARLLEHLAGEAKELMEHLPLEKIIDDEGYKNVLALLDEKYKELEGHELQRVLKEYFYEITIKSQETYRNFTVRLETSYRALVRHGVQLPDEVRGWFLMRKLSLDATAEAMVLTSSGGSIKYDQVVKAIKSVFPYGKSGTGTKQSKEVFMADEPEQGEGHDEGPEEVMEVIASELQEADEYESEDALEAYEAYVNVRQKMREKKTARGYKMFDKEKKQTWSLQGTMKGKIEMLKQKTKCHICRKQGHWKKECPMRKGATDKETATKTKEVHIVDDDDDDEYLDAYILEGIKQEEPPGNHHQKTGQVEIEEKEERQLRQKKDYWTLTDDGKFVIRHHVRSRKCLFTPHQVQGMPVDVTSLTGKRITEVKGFDESIEDNYKTSPEPHRNLGKPWIGSTSFEVTGSEAAPMENRDQVAVTMSHDEGA
jgi:hypothetical protein